jgi:hypothetical protein
MNSYELYRSFFDWCFENPQKVSPNHVAIYCFSVEHCNRLGWKKNFGLPTTMVMEAVGIKSYNTYSKSFNDLVEFGFITLVEKSRNQYSANIIALSKFNKALDKALDKAMIKHKRKQSDSTIQSIDSINKPINIIQVNKFTNIQLEQIDFSKFDHGEILNIWLEWLNYKWDQFNQEYKTIKSNQTALNSLCKLSKGKTEIAGKIVDQSISNLYKGLFEFKGYSTQKINYDDNFRKADGSIDHEAKRNAFVDRVLGRDQQENATEKFGNIQDIGFIDVSGK